MAAAADPGVHSSTDAAVQQSSQATTDPAITQKIPAASVDSVKLSAAEERPGAETTAKGPQLSVSASGDMPPSSAQPTASATAADAAPATACSESDPQGFGGLGSSEKAQMAAIDGVENQLRGRGREQPLSQPLWPDSAAASQNPQCLAP